ncbi:hypothetical protein Q9233_013692 [Columba guinea]|nr:hypothetical protein Q9233_013692 [Columba guinea]
MRMRQWLTAAVPAADRAVALEEMGSAEGDPLKLPKGASAGPELESMDTKGPSTPARRCALCNCGDWSPHGQQELQRFEPAPDWPEQLVGHNPPGGPGHPPLELEPVGDDLAQIGFSEQVTPVQLFEPTEDARCSVCDGPGDLRDLVFCTGCGQHYHGGCLDVALTPRKRSGWQCPECKVCQTCRQPGQDSMMLVCEACDKGYHTFCMEPAIESLPTDSWKCKNCRVCSDCGRRPAELSPGCQWYQSYSLCQGCQQHRGAQNARGTPAHAPQPDPPAQTLTCPNCSEPMDVPIPSPEPVGCNEKPQPGGDPREGPLGAGGSPPGKPSPAELPPDELSLDKPLPDELPPDVQPPEEPPPVVEPPEEPPPLMEPPPLVQPSEEPPPLVQPSEEPPSLMQPSEEPPPLMLSHDKPPPDELPLEIPSLDKPPLDGAPLEQLPPNEQPLDVPPLNELPPNKQLLEKLPPDELPLDEPPLGKSPPDKLPLDKSPPDELPLDKLPPSELPLDKLPPSELPLDKSPPDERPLNKSPHDEPPPNELPLDALPPDELHTTKHPLDELPLEELPPAELSPEEPLPSEPPPEEDPTPPGLIPEVAVAEEAPALAPAVPPEEEMELELEPLLPPETAPPPPAPPDLRAVSPVLPRDPSPDTKEDEVPELRPPALPEPPSSPSTAMDTEPPGSPPPPLGSPVCAPAPTEPLEDEEMEMAGGEGESPASPPGAAPQASPAPELGPFPGLPEEEEEEEEEAPRLEREGTSGSSPPLSEEDALEEGRVGGDPEAKGSPLLLEPEELGPETPMEVCAAGEKLLGRGDEAGPEPPTLRPRPDILNEISNLSQGDTSSSFPGSEPLLGSPDPEGGGSLSLELGPALADASLQKEDAASLPLGAETDDSLLFEPAAKGDGDKSRRRSSPGRSRVKQLADVESSPSKEEDEDDDDTMQNTVVLFSNTDKFVLMQDMCVVCGSFGRGAEGHLLACSQCSQCYHPYCVNSKITKVMLLKGWRCVECIVCEVCGKASDPSRLLLCDDCDISYHTYCLDPPLQTVPKGGWKCKWCVCCVQCGAASPGFHCEWQNNYTHCAPCASLVVCPFCHQKYVEDDLLIQCRHCDRWLHAACNSLLTEEEVEQAADEGFDCSACQPYVVKPAVPTPPPEIAAIKAKEPEPQYFRFEGVWLTETGMAVLRNLSLSPLHKRRQRKGRPGALNGDGALEGGDPLGPDDKKDGDLDADELLKAEVGVEHMECEIKLEAPASPDRDIGADGDSGKGLEDPEESKKRKRKPYRPGIGGFMVRQRKSHTRLKKVSVVLAEVGREALSAEGHPEDGDDSTDGSAAAPDDDGKDDAKAEDLGPDEPKDSPDPGDTEKPASPGECALSSDLDKIPTEGSVSLGSLSGSVSLDSYSGICQSPFLDSRERSGFFSPDHCEPESPWASSSAATTPSTPTTPTTEGEGDGLSYNQRSLQRWEKDEELGELSTISPVLYANMNFPNLKQDYPDWSSRCKQIMKLWRKVPATDKAPYLQKAKDNRAAHRINKVQKQAESQINKQTKGEGLRKPERPSLHLRIPVPPGAQPVYIGSPPADTEGFLKPPPGAGAGPESPSELFLKLPPQSPAQVPSHDPYGAAPAYALEPRFPSPLGQSPTAGAAFQPFPGQPQPGPRPGPGSQPPEFHPTSPGTPRHQPGTPDPFLKPRCPSLDNLSVPGSPGARPPEALLSPLPFGEQKKGLEVKKEDGGSLGVCSPSYAPAMGYGDSSGGPHLSAVELKAPDVFKAPLTPRVSQVEPQSPGLGHRPLDPPPAGPLAPRPP